MSSELDFVVPDWPAPDRVKAFSTTRTGGISEAPWASFNLGGHVSDAPECVEENRLQLARSMALPRSSFCFMEQVHGTNVVELPQASPVRADGCATSRAGIPCLVMTADCLPVLFCSSDGTRVAAAHAGWRGLCSGVLEKTLKQFSDVSGVMAWLGPAIGPTQFEVGDDVRDAFVGLDTEARRAFTPAGRAGHYLADLYRLARHRLLSAGVEHIYGGHWCTYSESDRFFSYRRDGVTGRMASLVFID